MFVKERFKLDQSTVDILQSMTPKFGYNGFGEFLFYRTYSRIKKDGTNESWADCVQRVTEGTFSIRKDWYKRNHITWAESDWQHYSLHFAISMFKMEWLPPGRGLWAMGTDFVYERGSMALQNCGLTVIKDIPSDIHWLMDTLMCGVGVGFVPIRDDDIEVYSPKGTYDFEIPDTREGWCDSVQVLIESFLSPESKKPRFIYDKIRPAGLPIKGFGGVASGPEPLKELHIKIEEFIDEYACEKWYDSVLLKTDLANATGCCVIAGNVRRSAELSAGDFDDPVFMDMKDYIKYPHRAAHGWMSNNSVFLSKDEDFERLSEIAKRVKMNGEPGFINLRNLPKGRIGKSMDGLREDKAIAFNPCGEQPLEDKELCTLVETLPTMCPDQRTWLKACEYATVYACSVTLLPTHRPETNQVMARNRRIGVGVIDVSGWKHEQGLSKVIKYMREGYEKVRSVARWINNEAGVPEPIRHTTVKPGGTTPKLAGKTSGVGHPNFKHTLRRVRLGKNAPQVQILIDAGVPYEDDVVSANTYVFEFPILQGPARPSSQVTLWEQAFNLVTCQREWADNAVSNTLNFRPKWNLIKEEKIYYIKWDARLTILDEDYTFKTAELTEIKRTRQTEVIKENDIKLNLSWNDRDLYVIVKIYEYDPAHEEDVIEDVLAAIAPLTKSVSVLPHSPKGAYNQMPEEGITEDEYNKRVSKIKKINWQVLKGSDGADEKYCTAESCMPVGG